MRLTPKQKVLKKHPGACAKEWFAGWSSIDATKCTTEWIVHSNLTSVEIDRVLGKGATANQAWADAARMLK